MRNVYLFTVTVPRWDYATTGATLEKHFAATGDTRHQAFTKVARRANRHYRDPDFVTIQFDHYYEVIR